MLRGLLLDLGGVLDDGPQMRDLARRVRAAGVKIALVTDAEAVPGEVGAAVDVVVAGRVAGMGKPDPELFRHAAGLLGLDTAECVVVDDVPANVRGARAAGAVVVLHRDPGTTVAEIEILLGLA